ncbi:hypothetical protein [Endozoicomonas sp.]|nr:hypothetical protein [Endozoicomonas sp.]
MNKEPVGDLVLSQEQIAAGVETVASQLSGILIRRTWLSSLCPLH